MNRDNLHVATGAHVNRVKNSHTQPFNDPLSATTQVGRYQKKHSPTQQVAAVLTSSVVLKKEVGDAWNKT